MYLAILRILNFRRIDKAEFEFQPGLNILVGPNNVGKTAVIDALRALLAGHDEPYPRFDISDFHRSANGDASKEIAFDYIFRGLDADDEADFLPALKPDGLGGLEARISVRYSVSDKSGRLRVRRWCGDHEEVALTSDIMENLRGVYLPPLRDASLGLRPSRFSQVARLFQLLTDESGRDGINQALKRLDDELKRQAPIVSTSDAIVLRHKEMLGDQLAQMIDLGLSSGDFRRLASRLSISVDGLDVDQNGLGYNNLIYMAVVLSELSKSPEASYRSLLVEEPEAHLHPQLQAVLLRYLERIHAVKGERPVQIFVTSHSPNFASIADVSCLTCMVDVGGRIDVFSPRKVNIDKRKLDKLKRYLDVTRAELFFARRVIFVEGAAELMLVGVLAKNSGFDLRAYGVSLISVEGLNFDSFMPLFGEHALRIPVSVITDADPGGDDDDLRYPSVNDNVKVSDNAAKMKAMEDSFVRVFYGVKTLEYDLALYQENRNAMLGVLYDMHPKIARQIEDELETVSSDAEAARVMFSGMFERKSNNVQKGRFAQSLAQRFVEQPAECRVPDYIVNAVRHVCQAAGCG